jgi:hypothetical protein
VINTEATREIEQRTFEGDKQAAGKIGVVDVEQVISLITDRLDRKGDWTEKGTDLFVAET